MAEQGFREFIERKTKQALSAKKVDWDERRDGWLQKLKELYGDMGSSLEPFGQEIRILIGAKGRVDLSGPRKTLKIVLLGEGKPTLTVQTENGGVTEESSHFMARGKIEDAGWYIATTPPDTTVVPFNGESFQDAIMEVSGG